MNSSSRLLTISCRFKHIPVRNRTIVKHALPLPTTPPGQDQRSPLEKQLFQKYTVVDVAERKTMPFATIILIKNVEGIGKAGEIVQVRSHMVREFFIPSGSAVYASPYNIEKYTKLRDIHEEPTMEPHIKLGISKNLYDLATYINSKTVPVYVALENKWTLEKWHIALALRLHDISVPENQIIVNTTPIQGPDMILQNHLFRFYIVVNGRMIIPGYGRIQHVTTKTYRQMLTPTLPDPTSLTEEESTKAGLLEEDIYFYSEYETDSLSTWSDEKIWQLMKDRTDTKKKEMETNPALVSRRLQAAMDAEAKKKRDKEIQDLRCQSFNLAAPPEPWDERELALKKQKARRNRYWDDDLHNWQEPLGKF